MNNVCLAGQVAVLFRRLVHVVSTVSVAQQYHFYKRNRSTAEHTSSPRTIEFQDLSLAQTLLDPYRSSTLPRVLVEQWGRLKGGSFWESCRSSLTLVQEPNFSTHLLHSQVFVLLISLQVHLHSCHGLGQRDHTRPILPPSPHPIKLPFHTPAQLRNPNRRVRTPTHPRLDGPKNQRTTPSRN